MRTYPAEIIKPSGIVGEEIVIETRNFRRCPPRNYEFCDKLFYVINTQDNTKVQIEKHATVHCVFLNQDKDEKIPFYIRKDVGAILTGKKILIQSLDKNITKLDKYSIINLTSTHKAQVLKSNGYTKCSLEQERDDIIKLGIYDTLVALKLEKQLSEGLLEITL